jgi:hypothetical protein
MPKKLNKTHRQKKEFNRRVIKLEMYRKKHKQIQTIPPRHRKLYDTQQLLFLEKKMERIREQNGYI